MGGSSSPARFFAEAAASSDLLVLDTSNPDSIGEIDFASVNVVASSKSGTTIETQSLLAHALASGLRERDLVVITDPGTSLADAATHLGALVIFGDPETGGRFSALSPFGLVPALYAGWNVHELRSALEANHLTRDLAARAFADADTLTHELHDGQGFFPLSDEPVLSGGALWLEQLVAETTGKNDRGLVPVVQSGAEPATLGNVMYFELLASCVARALGVDPFNQPDVERAKQQVLAILSHGLPEASREANFGEVKDALSRARYTTLQIYAPLDAAPDVALLRRRVQGRFGTVTANLGPRYLHSTGQLHKGGPRSVVGLQIVVASHTRPQRVQGRHFSFHDLHWAQAESDRLAMDAAGRHVWQFRVDSLEHVDELLELAS